MRSTARVLAAAPASLTPAAAMKLRESYPTLATAWSALVVGWTRVLGICTVPARAFRTAAAAAAAEIVGPTVAVPLGGAIRTATQPLRGYDSAPPVRTAARSVVAAVTYPQTAAPIPRPKRLPRVAQAHVSAMLATKSVDLIP